MLERKNGATVGSGRVQYGKAQVTLLLTKQTMKSSRQQMTTESSSRNGAAYPEAPNYSVMVVVGAIMALALLSGCASAPAGGSTDPYEYNTATGYPAVGGQPWR